MDFECLDRLGPGVKCDPDLRHGDVRRHTIAEGWWEFHMTRDTYLAVVCTSGAERLLDEAMEHLDDGVYPLPRSIIHPEAAEDLQHAIAYADLADPNGCVMPGCLLEPVTDQPGFKVCRHHHELLQGWDALTAA